MLTPLTLLPTPALLSVPRPSRPQQNKAKRIVQSDSESSEDKPLAKKPKKPSSKDKKKERKARRDDDSDSPPPKSKTKAKDKKHKRADDSPPPASTKKDKKPVRKVGEARRATGEALTDDAGNRYIDLGANKRVVVSDFKGKTLIQIREYYNDDGQWKPGKKVRSLPLLLLRTQSCAPSSPGPLSPRAAQVDVDAQCEADPLVVVAAQGIALPVDAWDRLKKAVGTVRPFSSTGSLPRSPAESVRSADRHGHRRPRRLTPLALARTLVLVSPAPSSLSPFPSLCALHTPSSSRSVYLLVLIPLATRFLALLACNSTVCFSRGPCSRSQTRREREQGARSGVYNLVQLLQSPTMPAVAARAPPSPPPRPPPTRAPHRPLPLALLPARSRASRPH